MLFYRLFTKKKKKKKRERWHACGRLQINLIQAWYDDRYYRTLHFDTSQIDLDLFQGQGCEKATTSAPTILQSYQSI